MSQRTNEFGQPIGPAVPDWKPARYPDLSTLEGRFCRLERLTADHADTLWPALKDAEDSLYTYLPFGPFAGRAAFETTLRALIDRDGLEYYAIVDGEGAAGIASYMRIDTANGVIEVGGICYSPRLQRTAVASEAMYLMLRHAFETMGYRRYEWKCDALNAPSRAAALRLGFQYEGLFRQAIVYKGRSRDTTWFAITDGDWARVKSAHEAWLEPENFDDQGRQKSALAARA
ncbi:MAG: GNAT family protein [Alphaproteobacteria bacterium]